MGLFELFYYFFLKDFFVFHSKNTINRIVHHNRHLLKGWPFIAIIETWWSSQHYFLTPAILNKVSHFSISSFSRFCRKVWYFVTGLRILRDSADFGQNNWKTGALIFCSIFLQQLQLAWQSDITLQSGTQFFSKKKNLKIRWLWRFSSLVWFDIL